jgi:hypothetical protein
MYQSLIAVTCLAFVGTARVACIQSGKAVGLQTGITTDFNRLEGDLSKPYVRALTNQFTAPELAIIGLTYKTLVTKSIDINLDVHYFVDTVEFKDSIGNYMVYFKWKY